MKLINFSTLKHILLLISFIGAGQAQSASGLIPAKRQTPEQIQADIASCQSQASKKVSPQTAPATRSSTQSQQASSEAFNACMIARGYKLEH
jgi:hypothetical protein